MIGLILLVASILVRIDLVKYSIIMLQLHTLASLFMYATEFEEDMETHILSLTLTNVIEICLNVIMISKFTNRF
jgi:hypothetical protein